MLFTNRELDRAFDFIAQSDFDIFCLQEVPGEFLARLKTLPYFIAFRTDVEQIRANGNESLFIVILSKHPIIARGEIIFPDYAWSLLPLRTRISVLLMRPFGFFKIRNRGGLYVDLERNGQSLRVFTFHLILAHPSWRLKEFEMSMVKRDATRPTIVCGDFNILEKPHITPLNWILGGRVSDALLYGRERTHIEKRFVEHELLNPLRGKMTHPLSRSQLDHILVSHSFSIKNAEVISDRAGSDHHPIYIEVQ